MIEILENATIVYTDGVKERFDAIYMTEKMAITGRIFKINGTELCDILPFINEGASYMARLVVIGC